MTVTHLPSPTPPVPPIPPARRIRALSIVRTVITVAIFFIAPLLASLWAVGAIYYDLPWPEWRLPLAVLYGLGMTLAIALIRRGWLIATAGFLIVAMLWLRITPATGSDLDWQPDVAQTAYAEISEGEVIIHNVRHCDYRTELDYTPHWKSRRIDLAKVRGMDLAITYWGSPMIAHPIVSFQIEGEPPLAISVETRKRVGQDYSTIAGFYRQYQLIYIVSDERDLLRLRSNFRQGEDVYLFRTAATPEQARQILVDYLKSANRLHQQPEFYNVVTDNCTTNIRLHVQATEAHPDPWDWRILLNGYLDELLYQKHALIGEGPFAALKARSLINPAARRIGDAPDFSRLIREAINLPGLPSSPTGNRSNRSE